MKYIAAGNSKERVPVLGFGLGKGIGSEARGARYGADDVRALHQAVDLGLTFIDVAFDYGQGAAETLVGEATQGIRDRVFIASKLPSGQSGHDQVLRCADQALKRLRTDRIDLFQTHWPNPRIPLEDTMAALDQLLREGKVRHLGLSNCTPAEARLAASFLRDTPLSFIQHEYNLLDRSAETEMIPLCQGRSITFTGYSPLAHLRLHPDDPRLATLREIASGYGVDPQLLVLAWLTRYQGSMSVVRSNNPAHLKANAAFAEFNPAPEDLDRVGALFPSTLRQVPASSIWVQADAAQKTYGSSWEAGENLYGHVPSPLELAGQIRAGEVLKPIKVTSSPEAGRPYQVVEGKIRYWAWVLAYGEDVLIPTIIRSDAEVR